MIKVVDMIRTVQIMVVLGHMAGEEGTKVTFIIPIRAAHAVFGGERVSLGYIMVMFSDEVPFLFPHACSYGRSSFHTQSSNHLQVAFCLILSHSLLLGKMFIEFLRV